MPEVSRVGQGAHGYKTLTATNDIHVGPIEDGRQALDLKFSSNKSVIYEDEFVFERCFDFENEIKL